MGNGPIIPVEPVAPISAIPRATLEPSRRVQADEAPPGPIRRRSQPTADRTGTLVSAMVINLDAGRIALLSPEGPPVCGDVSTDLAVGSYELKPDRVKKQWAFEPRQVKSGLRFRVTLDGADPFALAYVEALNLSVTLGFTDSGQATLAAARQEVMEAVSDRRAADAFVLLDALCDIDLYDLVEDIWADSPGTINELLMQFEATFKTERCEMNRLLLALEGVAVDPKKLYLDAFNRYSIEPKSFAKNEEREDAGQSNLMIRFEYWLAPERAVIVFADDILATTAVDPDRPRHAEGGLLYPRYCTRGSTPRMWEAKKDCIAQVEAGNFEVVQEAAKASMHVINFVFMANSLLISTVGAAGGTKPSPRPVSEAFAKQPGRWLRDFEAGTNMSEEALAYEARVCNKDPAIGYYVNGVQFDGIEREVLIDAKYYTEQSRTTRSLLRNNPFLGNRCLAQAERQVAVAAGRQVEWRVASAVASDKLRELFRVNKVPVRVVFMP